MKVVCPKYLPPRLPLGWTIIVWLLMDRLQASGICQGVVYTLLSLWWVATIWAFTTCRYMEPTWNNLTGIRKD